MKSILITGAARGVGRNIALEAARSGLYNRIIINCRSRESSLKETEAMVNDLLSISFPGLPCECISSLGDVGDIKYVEKLHESIGEIDVLINNAAISMTGLLTDMTPEEWDIIVKTNLTSIYNTCHTFVPGMIRAKAGKILNISSVWGIKGASCEVAYSATKGAVNAFTMALAKELAPSNIQVNAAALGIVDTEMNSQLTTEDKVYIIEEIPAGYIMSAEEAACAVMSLIDMPPYFTGEIVKIDGGWQ